MFTFGSLVRRSCLVIFLIDRGYAQDAVIKYSREYYPDRALERANPLNIGSPSRARTYDLRINSPAGHRPESRASQRSWPRRPVIFSAGLASFPLRTINSASQYYRASSPLRTQICEPATIWFVALATNARRASLRPMIPQRSREGSRRSAEDLASRAAF